MIIGITGTLGSGKGAISEYLIEKGFKHFSVREYLLKIIRERGMLENRDSMVSVANELRQFHGSSYIVEQLYDRAKFFEEKMPNSIIESIRTVGEVEALKAKGSFYLIAVDCDIKERYSRVCSRSSETDDVGFDKFQEDELREMTSDDPSKQNLVACKELADFNIDNSGSFESLYSQVDGVLEKIKLEEDLSKNISGSISINGCDSFVNNSSGEVEGFCSDVSGVENNLEVVEEKYVRPTWDEYFMEISKTVAKRATCDRGRSGCVIQKDNQLLVSGYVGSPMGLPHCDDVGHDFKKVIHEDGHVTNHCVRTVHAEQNAICQAAKLGISLNGSTLYCKMTPCRVCAMLIINCGIKRVVCEKKYHAGVESEEMFKKVGIELYFFSDELEQYSNQ